MKKLKIYKFSDLYDMSSGISSKPEQAGHGTSFLSFSSVFNNQFVPDVLPDLMSVSEKEQKKYSIKEGDIFLTRTSETLDELAMSSVSVKEYPDATYSGFLKRLRPKQTDITYHKFMAFYLRSKLFRKTMSNNAIMTLRASLNEQIFSYLDLVLPELGEQIKIGDFLYLINQKIELNNKINAELEAMAKLIYDYWFVQFDFPYDFEQGKFDLNGKPYKSSGGKMVYNEALKREIPKGWKAFYLSEVLKSNYSSIGKNDDYEDINYLDTANLTKNQIDDIVVIKTHFDKIPSRAKRVVNHNDIFYSTVRPNLCHYGIIKQPMQNMIASTGFAQLSSKVSWVGNDFIYTYLTSSWITERLQQIAALSVSAYPSISPNDILALKIALPENKKILKHINSSLDDIYSKISINHNESKELAKLRDWLLPMLMNGQVTVK